MMDVRLPNLGEGADSGTVVSLLVAVGDSITAGQNVVEIENGKAVVSVPSPTAGRVQALRVKPGDKISTGAVLLTLEGGSAAANSGSSSRVASSAPAASAAPVPPVLPAAPLRSHSSFPPAASPTIRKLARDLGLDLTRIPGSEAGGRIVLEDIRRYIQQLQERAFPSASAPSPAPAVSVQSVDFSKWGPITRQPLTALRKTIARRMVESWTTIPHVTQFDEADISGILRLRQAHKETFEKDGASLTVTVFVLRALVRTLQRHPVFNASLDEGAGELVLKNHFHIGIAVDTEAGLIVPVIRDVDKKDLRQIARELAELAAKTRERKVSPDDLSGGTFTVSNQGGIGGAHFTPIVNKPEVAILGLGRGLVKPGAKSGQIEVATMLPLALSYDHRVIDGGSAARFIKDLVAALETFDEAELKA